MKCECKKRTARLKTSCTTGFTFTNCLHSVCTHRLKARIFFAGHTILDETSQTLLESCTAVPQENGHKETGRDAAERVGGQRRLRAVPAANDDGLAALRGRQPVRRARDVRDASLAAAAAGHPAARGGLFAAHGLSAAPTKAATRPGKSGLLRSDSRFVISFATV